jgi:polysaccharide chain length determinant protein (PEP-CTERM system associated)
VLPGKTYKPEEILTILWRRRWAFVLPIVVAAVTGVAVARILPNKYRSDTLVLVVPQRVPESYVRATVTTRIEDRVSSIREQILSRSRLERIIAEFDLYPQLRARMATEDVIEEMRSNVYTRVVREDAFSVSFVADRPDVAQKVTERLAGMFSEENMRDREVQAESTNQFLQTQLDEARQRLIEHERKVEEYRRRYAGELPDQVVANQQTIQNTEMQIQTVMQALNSDRDRRLLFERQLADAVNNESTPGVPQAPNAPVSTAQALDAAENNLQSLRGRLTAEHPDLIQAQLAVDRLKKQLEAERAAAGTDTAVRLSPAEAARRNRITDLRAQLDAVDRSIAQRLEEEQRLRAMVAAYRAKIEASPTRETELVALTRDYETLQRQYRGLLEKYEESKVAANLERRQIGEQFRVLDPARVPERPFTPNRLLISAAGVASGVMLGLLLVGGLEFRDKTLRSSEDVALCCPIPVLAVLPSIRTRLEVSKAKRLRNLSWALAVGVVMMAGAAVLAYFDRIAAQLHIR